MLAISGEGFRPRTRVDVSTGRAREDSGFGGKLGGIAFDAVSLDGATSLHATVPPGLGVGVHDLVITPPEGRTLSLADAFQVIALDGGVPPDGGDGRPPRWPGTDPTWADLSTCGNGRCTGTLPGCPTAGVCPSCDAGLTWHGFAGDWRIVGNHTTQMTETVARADAVVEGLSAADVYVQTDLSVSATGDPGPSTVAVLIHAASPCDAPASWDACVLEWTPDARIRLESWDGGAAPAWEAEPGGEPIGTPLDRGADYTVRVAAVGDQRYCALCTDATCATTTASLVGTSDLHASGTVGLSTTYARMQVRQYAVWTP